MFVRSVWTVIPNFLPINNAKRWNLLIFLAFKDKRKTY